MSNVRAVILAGGLGTRLRPLTETTPKCLIPVAGRPCLEYWRWALADAGVRDILLNNHHLPELVRDYIAKVNGRLGQRVTETFEPRLLGSAGTLKNNRAFADGADAVIVIYADNFSDVDLRSLVDFHQRHDDPFTMLLFHAPNPSACGIAELDGDDRIVEFVEKPDEPTSDLANAGIYVVDAELYREIADFDAFDLGKDVLPKLAGRMRGFVHDGYHLDVGTLEAYERVRRESIDVLAKRGGDSEGRRPAAFFDRDGTLIESVHYLSNPDDVKLIDGAAEAIIDLRRQGYAIVVVSNQSAIGRGKITEDDHLVITERMCAMFAEHGVVFDQLLHCPAVPGTKDRTVVETEDRKPGPGMLKRAAADLHLNLGRSIMVGDFASDVLAGVNAGCALNVLVGEHDDAAAASLRGIDYKAIRSVADLPALLAGAPATP